MISIQRIELIKHKPMIYLSKIIKAIFHRYMQELKQGKVLWKSHKEGKEETVLKEIKGKTLQLEQNKKEKQQF